MDPLLHDGEYVYCVADVAPSESIATFREVEGLTVVLERSRADELRLSYSYVAAWITLNVYSDLDAVGFLAAISQRLAAAGVSCNVFSAFRHDHLFVPHAKRVQAMDVLRALSSGS